MLHTLFTFLPVAALLTITPGVATLGVLAWAALVAFGLAAVVAASAAA